MQISVVMVNPDGTGIPKLVMSAKLAPLPPKRSFILPVPSALPLPKKYTRFFEVFLLLVLVIFFAVFLKEAGFLDFLMGFLIFFFINILFNYVNSVKISPC